MVVLPPFLGPTLKVYSSTLLSVEEMFQDPYRCLELQIVWSPIQAYLGLVRFTSLHFADVAFFTNLRFMPTPRPARLLAPFFQ